MCLRSRPWTALHSPDDPIWAPFLELAEFNSIPPWTSLECLGKALSEFIQKLPHRYSGVLLLKQINHQSSVPSSVCVWEAVPIARVAAPTEDSWLKEMEVWRKKRGTYRGGQSEASGFLLILRESERCTDDTFKLVFHLQKQSNISQRRFLSCMACKQYRCFGNHDYLIWVQWECQKRTKWFKQELLWLPQPIDSVNCVPAKEFVLLSRVR